MIETVSFPTKRVITLFFVFHVIAWTLVPAYVRYNLPMDSLEGAIWGHELQWGYDKNPFLNGWLTALAIYLTNYSDISIYFFSQLSVVIGMWALWELGKKVTSSLNAFIAVLLLEGIQYYNFHAIDFNDNTLELSLWALTIYFFYNALTLPSFSKNVSWALCGLFAGLGMMAKYYTASLLAAMLFFLLSSKATRKMFSDPSLYLGLAIFVVVICPHIIWLFFHDFITVTYVFDRASSPPQFSSHLYYPSKFALDQLLTFLPALLLFCLFFSNKKQETTLNTFNQRFLIFLGLGPFILTLLLSLALGINLRAGWGMPLLGLWPLMLVSFNPPKVSYQKMLKFVIGIFLVSSLLLGAYTTALLFSKTPSSANFPGQLIATQLTKSWHEAFHAPLSYVAGSRFIGGNLSFYSKDHPAVFIEWDKRRAPWIDTKDLAKKGGLFLWDISKKESLPAEVLKTFPQLRLQQPLAFQWMRNKELVPIEIGIAFLPPKSQQKAHGWQ